MKLPAFIILLLLGVPVFAQTPLYQSFSATAAWTTATAVDTALTIDTVGKCTVTVTLITTTTMTVGTINFEFSKDGTTFMPMHVARMLSQNSEAVYSLATPPENRGWQANVCATQSFRVRLNPAITGTGTATLSIVASAGSSNPVIVATQSNAGILNATVAVASAVPGTGATNLGKAEDAAHTTADVGVYVLGVRTDPTTTASTSANGDYGSIAIDHVGAVYNGIHPGAFSCFKENITATTECKAAPAAGLRAYVSSIECSNEAATVQTIDVVFGTGTNCGTGTTALTHKFQMGTNALTTSPMEVSADFIAPLVPTAANAICVRPGQATAFGCTITGIVAP